jgi:hypothetical protein
VAWWSMQLGHLSQRRQIWQRRRWCLPSQHLPQRRRRPWACLLRLFSLPRLPPFASSPLPPAVSCLCLSYLRTTPWLEPLIGYGFLLVQETSHRTQSITKPSIIVIWVVLSVNVFLCRLPFAPCSGMLPCRRRARRCPLGARCAREQRFAPCSTHGCSG